MSETNGTAVLDEPTTESTETQTPEPQADPTPAPALAARIAEFDAETVRLIGEAEANCEEMEAEYETAKKAAKEAKDAYEVAVSGMRQLIHRRAQGLQEVKRGQQTLPFGDDARPTDETPAPDEAWRAIDISALQDHGLPGGIVGKLVDAEIRTIGDLSNWHTPPPTGQGKTLTDIPGVGQAKADKIDEALAKFWEARNAATLTNSDAEDEGE